MSSRASCGAITRFAGDGHKPVPNAGDGLDEAGLPPVVLQLGAERPDVPVDVGAWVVTGVPWTWTLFGLDRRAEAHALNRT